MLPYIHHEIVVAVGATAVVVTPERATELAVQSGGGGGAVGMGKVAGDDDLWARRVRGGR